MRPPRNDWREREDRKALVWMVLIVLASLFAEALADLALAALELIF